MSCAGRDKWVSMAEGIVEIWRCKEVVSAASSALKSKTSSTVRVAWQSYIINVLSTSHTRMRNDSCGKILIYPVLGISVSHTADSLSVSFHCTLKRRSQTPDNAPCCRLHCDSCIHLQWRKLTCLKNLQRFKFLQWLYPKRLLFQQSGALTPSREKAGEACGGKTCQGTM